MSGEANAWYHGLAAQGLTLSDVILGEIMPEGPTPINEDAFQTIKRAWLEFRTRCDDFDKKPTEAEVQDMVFYGLGVMPAYGEDETLTKEQIDIVSFYVAKSAGK